MSTEENKVFVRRLINQWWNTHPQDPTVAQRRVLITIVGAVV